MWSAQRFVKNYLNFTSRERFGILGLLILIALFHFLPILLYSKGDFTKELAQFETQIAQLDTIKVTKGYSNSLNKTISAPLKFEPFYFDPNTVNPNDLLRFGVPDYVINRFAKYRAAGAQFYKKEDLKKLYGLKNEIYLKIEPYIRIAAKPNSNETKAFVNSKQTDLKYTPNTLEINSADSMSLLQIKGIGPYLCSKILKYRHALGGFISLDQLNEIYSIKPEHIKAIKPYLTLNVSNIVYIDLNRADYYQLNAHPYISSKEANAILAYRQQHGTFRNVYDLQKIYILSNEMIQKVSPYLKF